MDNLTHMIAGLVTAELAVHARARLGRSSNPASPASPASAAWPTAAWLVSGLAHNTPDADAVYTRITEGTVGYLLHHRGHTHTLALVPLMAALAYGVMLLWARARRHALTRADHRWLVLLALLGPLGHLALDLTNNYGIHPLWPAWNGWLYGDTIFIVEPLFWACTMPALFAASRWRPARIAWVLLGAAGLALTWLVPLVSRPAAVGVTGLALASVVIARRVSAAPRALFAFGASLAVVAAFLAGSAAASGVVRRELAAAYPGWETLDLARSSLPAAPWCWDAIAVQRDRRSDRYALRKVRGSVWTSMSSAAMCDPTTPEPLTAHLRRGSFEGPAAIELGAYEAPLAELREAGARCDGAGYLRWSRAPFRAARADGSVVLGDLRYDRSADVEFAEIVLPPQVARCPEHVPPWLPPRADLLAEPAQ